MDINALKAFIQVAELKSFSLAADRLHLTQPAVSKRVALLENQLGLRLIDRIGRQVSLTEAGTNLLPRAIAILSDIDDAERSLTNLSGNVAGNLTMGISHHLGLHRLPPLLKRFSETYPDVSLDIQFLASESAYDAVLQGKIEIAMTTLAQQTMDKIKTQKVWPDPLQFVVSTEHHLAKQDQVTLADLSLYGAILPELNTFTGTMIKTLFDNKNQPLKISMCTNYLETIHMMVSIGLGWSLLPSTLLDSSLKILPIESIRLSRNLGAIYHKDRTLSNSARAFLELLAAEPDKRKQEG